MFTNVATRKAQKLGEEGAAHNEPDTAASGSEGPKAASAEQVAENLDENAAEGAKNPDREVAEKEKLLAGVR